MPCLSWSGRCDRIGVDVRPIDKGVAPRVYTNYQDAGRDLQQRLGDYCSYCERQIETNLAVEHVQPKSRAQELVATWENFLLGCANCNSTKGMAPVILKDYFWPDVDNTLRSFTYREGGLVEPNPTLVPRMREKAVATLQLTGLDRYPGGVGTPPSTKDRRWLRRQEAWELAERYRNLLGARDSKEVRELIVDVATSRGVFSIWWTVFEGDIDMRKRLRRAFKGTHGGSFGSDENAVPRAGGQL